MVKVVHETQFLGRTRPIAHGPRLMFASYRLKSLPPAPADVDYSVKPAAFLKQVLLNNKLGCCTASGAFHVGGSMLANADKPIPYGDPNVLTFYSATTGYVDGDPSTDRGASEIDVLNYWAEKGLLGDGKTHRIAGRLSIDGTNPDEVMSALYSFGNLYFGIELSDDWLKVPCYDGQVWNANATSNPNNGHCVISVKGGAKAGGIVCDSWGYEVLMPFDTVAKYTAEPLAGELYTVLSADTLIQATMKNPVGLDWSQLLADIVA
jgi:hypothetical protein